MTGLQLDSVTKRYGTETVVNGVSLTIEQGEFFTLLGPSGSGKTTTLSMIAGVTLADEGKIWIHGQDATALPPRERGLGMVFQNYAIFPHLDVFGNVAFPLNVRKVPKDEVAKRVAGALAMVKLTGFEKRYARQLSGGQQQRVALARAIVSHPPLVLMDEPLGALDKNLRYHMQMEIKEISRRLGMTVVYVTHDQEEALTMSDRIAIMNRGRIAQMGAPRDVYERPDSAFVAKFLGEANLIPVKRDGGVLKGPGGAQFMVSAGNTNSDEGMIFLRPEKITLLPPEAPPGKNQLEGTVRHASFLGNIMRFEVALSDNHIVLCDAANASGVTLAMPGESVRLGWQASDARLLIG
jgi:putative spermidine/putrescine transport system ATP-binding protein